MKIFSALLSTLLLVVPAMALAQAPVTSVPSVDLARYSGKWFEIDSFPMFFQRNCIADTTAEYTAAADGSIEVHNRCRTDAGFDDATGRAALASASAQGFDLTQLRTTAQAPATLTEKP